MTEGTKFQYSVANALTWGNCKRNFKKANDSSLSAGRRFAYGLLGAAEVLPVISQVVSFAEWGTHSAHKAIKAKRKEHLTEESQQQTVKVGDVAKGFISKAPTESSITGKKLSSTASMTSDESLDTEEQTQLSDNEQFIANEEPSPRASTTPVEKSAPLATEKKTQPSGTKQVISSTGPSSTTPTAPVEKSSAAPSVAAVQSKPLAEEDICISIEGGPDSAELAGRHRTEDEEKILTALQELGKKPFSSIKNKEGETLVFVRLDRQGHSSSQYYLQINETTGEQKLVRSSYRRQTDPQSFEDAIRSKATLDISQKLSEEKNGTTITVERKTPLQDFGLEDLLVPEKGDGEGVKSKNLTYEEIRLSPQVRVIDASKVQIPTKELGPDDPCIYISGETKREDIVGRNLNKKEQAIHWAMDLISQGEPYVFIKTKEGESFAVVQINHKERGGAFYCLLVDRSGKEPPKCVALSSRFRLDQQESDERID